MNAEEERQTIQEARVDPRAFVGLYDHYFPRIHAYVRYRVFRPQDAEDIIADVFLKAMRRIGRFEWRHENSFAAWLFRIAHNMIVDYYRRYDGIELASIPDPALDSDGRRATKGIGPATSRARQPEDALTQRETYRQMRALILTLSPRRQEVITLRFFGGLRNKEIALVLGLDERTIASHLSRGLQDLRKRYSVRTRSRVLEEINL